MSTDTLLLDIPAARGLAGSLAQAAEQLFADQLALSPLLDDATTILRSDRTGALLSLTAARRGCERLAGDLRGRINLVERNNRALARIDTLSQELWVWPDRLDDPGRDARFQERRATILHLVDDNADHARRIERALDEGVTAAQAFRLVDARLRLEAPLRFEARIDSLMAAFGIDRADALEMIERVDLAVERLLRKGIAREDAETAMAIVETHGLDLDVALEHAADFDVGLLNALGLMLVSNGLGVTVEEYRAIQGLEEHFEVFDNATGGERDERVSAGDLRYVVEHPWLFTPSQVLGAQALLDQPLLHNRLDTADAETDIFGGEFFGSTEPGDGLIAAVDLKAFTFKAQLHTILGDYVDEIDIANDPSGIVDGYRSKNDLRRFIADNPDLPEAVLGAAQVALEAGWFDESWWQEHKDEVAMGAALLAAGLVVVVTGGAASMLVVVAAGAAAAGGTTVAVNLATGEPVFDDVFMNTLHGGFVGGGVHAVAAGTAAYGAATTGVARVAAIAGATSGTADVVAAGGIDLLIDEEYEAVVHDVANGISTVTGATELGLNAGEWATRRSIKFETVEEQLEALTDRISYQKQLRHIRDSPLYEYGGYFDDAADAQRVLDAVKADKVDVLGRTARHNLLVRYDEVSGIHVNGGIGELGVETNTFAIKGTAAPSVVPVRPGKMPPEQPGGTDV